MCTFNTSPCIPATRARQYTQGRCERTHDDELNLHTGREVVVSLAIFTEFFWHVHDHLNRMLGRSLIANFLLAMNEWPTQSYHVTQRFTKRNPLYLTYWKFENKSWTTCSRFLRSFAIPDKAVQFQQFWGKLRRLCCTPTHNTTHNTTQHKTTQDKTRKDKTRERRRGRERREERRESHI